MTRRRPGDEPSLLLAAAGALMTPPTDPTPATSPATTTAAPAAPRAVGAAIGGTTNRVVPSEPVRPVRPSPARSGHLRLTI